MTDEKTTRAKRRTVRLAALGVLAAAAAAGGLVARTALSPPAGPGARPFELGDWEYRRILPPGAPARYRLRVDVAHASPPTPADASADATPPAAPEFRLLMERLDNSSFVCLRWLEGDLDLVRIAGGERAGLLGRTSYPLPGISRESPECRRHVPETFIVDRSPGLWTVSCLGREVLVAGDPHDPGAGEEDVRDFAWAATPDWSLSARALQPVEEVHLEDSFARVSFNEDGTYDVRSGLWDLDAVKDVKRSVNAFRLRGRSRPVEGGTEPAVALFGRSFWRGYRAEAAVKFRHAGAGGLVFAAGRCAPDSGPVTQVTLLEEGVEGGGEPKPPTDTGAPLPLSRYGLLRWRFPESTDAPPGELEVVDVRVRRSADGKESRRERVLLSLPWTPRREQWHLMAVSLFDELGEVDVNGARAVFQLPPGLRSGECGLFADSEKGVLFDDVRVVSHDGFLHTRGCVPAPWAEEAPAGRALYRLPAGPAWLRLEAAPDAGPVGLDWHDAEGRGFALELDPACGRGEILRRASGPAVVPQRLAAFGLDARAEACADPLSDAGEAAPGKESREAGADARPSTGPAVYTLEIGDRECAVLRGREPLARAALPAPREGVVTFRGAAGVVRLEGGPLAALPALRHKARTFSDVDVRKHGDNLHPQHKWIGFVGWMKDASSWASGPDGLLTCETLLWGPVETSVEVSIPAEHNETAEIRLSPDGPGAKPVGIGLRRQADGLAIVDARGMERGTLAPAEGAGVEPGGKARLELRRSGSRVEALVDGSVAFVAPLPPSVPVRVEARGRKLASEDVSVRAGSVDESLFESAPVEWTRWRGHWDVTTKWQCDPRWTFLGLWTDALEKKSDAAAAFTRASYMGDQDLRFYFAFRDVLNNRHNDNRRYVRRDMNFAFACEGEDLASGYCLMLGGFDDRGTQLLRRGEIVHEIDTFKIPPFNPGVGHQDLHWRWFCLRILKRGDTITATLNDKELLAWRDPEPLEGGHVGVWVLGGGIILGRTRFSSERCGKELAGFETAPPSPVDGWWPLDDEHAVHIQPADPFAGEVRSAPGAEAGTPDGAPPPKRPPTRIVCVTNVAGGGHVGVAREADANGKTPGAVVFRARPGARVRAYAVPAAALRRGMPLGHGAPPRRILPSPDPDPSGELGHLAADGRWYVYPLGDALKAGEALVLGNWESDAYAAVGVGANGPGAAYWAGALASPEEAEDFVRRTEETTVLRSLPPNPCRAGEGPHATGPGRVGIAGGWEALDWGNPARLSVHGRAIGSGEFLLLACAAGKYDKVVVRRETALSFARSGAFRIDVYNATGREVPVAFAVWSDAENIYSESKPMPALPGKWSHLEFDIGARDFKTADSGWKHTSALRGPEGVREVALLFYTRTEGALAVQGVDVDLAGD